MESRHGHGRQEDGEVQAEGADQEQHQQDGHQIRPLAHVAETLAQAGARGLQARRAAQQFHAQQQQRTDHGRKRDGVDDEDPAAADAADQQAGHGRAQHARRIEGSGIERHGIGQVFFADDFGNESLAHGRIEGRHAAEQESKHIHMPQLHEAADAQQAQAQRQQSHGRLRAQQQFAPVEQIGRHARQGQQQQLRTELQGHDDADGAGIVLRQFAEHQPILRRALHPGADIRHEGAAGPDTVIGNA
ncbi:hypothetical protein D3C87_1223210 [compost metagenome]